MFNRQYGQYDYSQPMGYSAGPGMMPDQQAYTGQIFQPTPAFTPAASQSMYGSSFEDEPPLLEGKRYQNVPITWQSGWMFFFSSHK